MIRFRCTNGKCWSFYANKKHIKWLKSTNAFLSHIYVTFWFISCSPAAPHLKTVHFHSKSVNPVKMNLFHWVLFYVCLNLQKSFKSVTFSSRYFFFLQCSGVQSPREKRVCISRGASGSAPSLFNVRLENFKLITVFPLFVFFDRTLKQIWTWKYTAKSHSE